jgi:hypothetical protein
MRYIFTSWLVLAGIVLFLATGCSGLRVSAEIARIDEATTSTSTKPIPVRCMFVDCAGGVEK